MAEKIILVDGNALVHRAFHAVPPLTTRGGELVNAVYGFASMLLKAIADLRPSCVAVAFDLPAPTFRHREYAQYKAQRAKASNELYQQFGRVRELLAALNVPIFQVEGFEADDVLGALSQQAAESGLETVILTGDADALQLVRPEVRVLVPRKGVSDTVMYDEAAVTERYGIRPRQLADFKALIGDKSDNIPGVPGIGEKTAARLLADFGSVEDLLAGLDRLDEKQRDLLTRHADQIRQSKRLATIVTDVPVTLDVSACRVGSYDREKAVNLLRELEFRTLLGRLPEAREELAAPPISKPTGSQPQQMSLFDRPSSSVVPSDLETVPPGVYSVLDSVEALDALVERLSTLSCFAVDTETDSVDEMRATLVGISISPQPSEAVYIPLGHKGDGPGSQQLPLDLVLERLRPALENPGIRKYAHNGKYDVTVLARHGIKVSALAFDSMLGAYVLDATRRNFGLKDLAFSLMGVEMTPITSLIGSGRNQLSMAAVPIKAVADYAGADADMTYRLVQLLDAALRQESLWSLFSEVEMPLVGVLSRMERSGIGLDVKYLREFSAELHARIGQLEGEIYDAVGYRFNINSTQQLAQVLFTKLQLGSKRKTKVGQSTAVDVLDSLRGEHPVVDLILEFRQLVKLKSTYVDALPQLLHPDTGRLHTNFNQTGTVTGRLSSSDPNLQNIPTRTELGRKVRRAFMAGDADSVLVSADYSQIELRILAHISKDPGLLAAFHSGEDIHTATASQIFGVPIAEVSGDQRRMAKTINFGVIYGISDFGLAERVGIPRRQAGEFIQAYLGRYERVRAYVEATKRQAEEKGYVETLLGRRRRIPEIRVEHRGAREAALRTAINAPIQGTAADIIKLAMIRLDRALHERGLATQMLLQVHDELVFEVPATELAELCPLVRTEMEAALSLDVPLLVDLKTGPNWADMS